MDETQTKPNGINRLMSELSGEHRKPETAAGVAVKQITEALSAVPKTHRAATLKAVQVIMGVDARQGETLAQHTDRVLEETSFDKPAKKRGWFW